MRPYTELLKEALHGQFPEVVAKLQAKKSLGTRLQFEVQCFVAGFVNGIAAVGGSIPSTIAINIMSGRCDRLFEL